MFTKEELESWNELFPECAISESDLTNPTQPIVTKIFVAYLRKFGFVVDFTLSFSAEASDNTPEKRQFLLKLCNSIQNILKITDQSYTFYYFDLVRPTHKKISHTLGILLNYLYYFNMYKTDVFSKVNDRIKLRQDLQSRIKQLREENDINKQWAKERKEKILQLTDRLPVAQDRLKDLTVQNTQLKAEHQSLQESVKGLGLEMQDLKKQECTLKTQIVTENEAHDLQTQEAKLQEAVAQNKQLISSNESLLKKLQEQIKSLQDLEHSVKETKNVFPLELIHNYQLTNKKLDATKLHLATIENKKQDLLQKLSKQQTELVTVEHNLMQAKANWEIEVTQKHKALESVTQYVKAKTTKLNSLQVQQHSLECEIEQQLEIQEYLRKNLEELHATTTCLI